MTLCDTIWYNMIQYDTVWYNMIQYVTIWYEMTWYDMIWYDMVRYDMYKQNEWYQICKCHLFVHASSALYQLYNLCMSHQSHHETIHSRHIPQLALLASICVNIAVRTISNKETYGVLKTWLERNKLQKLRTHHAIWHSFVLLSSTMLILLCWCSTIVALFQPHSL